MITKAITRHEPRHRSPHRSLVPPRFLSLASVPALLLLLGTGCEVEVDDWDHHGARGSWNDHRHDRQGRCPTPDRCPWTPPPTRPPVDQGGAPDAGSPPPANPPPRSLPPPPPQDAGAAPVDMTPVDTTPPPPAGSAACRIDAQCGGGRCLAGACQPRCTSDASCGTGQGCRDGFCQAPLQPGTACLYSTTCGEAAVCINGFCHPRCSAPNGDGGGCANPADRCDRGVCRPDDRPRPQCTGNAQCQAGWACVDAICRTACQDDTQCGPGCSGTVCSRGFCVMPEELVPPMCPVEPCAGASGCPGVCR
jgi:hypothetical protein